MRSQISLHQVIGFFLLSAVLGFLIPLFNSSLNPFRAAPFWIVTSALFVLLLGLVLGLLAGRFPPTSSPSVSTGWVSACSRLCFSWEPTCFPRTQRNGWELSRSPLSASSFLGCDSCQVLPKSS
jgi:hypothetical protein